MQEKVRLFIQAFYTHTHLLCLIDKKGIHCGQSKQRYNRHWLKSLDIIMISAVFVGCKQGRSAPSRVKCLVTPLVFALKASFVYWKGFVQTSSSTLCANNWKRLTQRASHNSFCPWDHETDCVFKLLCMEDTQNHWCNYGVTCINWQPNYYTVETAYSDHKAWSKHLHQFDNTCAAFRKRAANTENDNRSVSSRL